MLEKFLGRKFSWWEEVAHFHLCVFMVQEKGVRISNWAQNGSIPFGVYTLTPIFQSAPFPCSVSPLRGRGVKEVLVEIPLYRMRHFF